MDIQRTCSIVLEKRPDGLARLRYRIRWNGSRNIVAVNIHYLVDPEKWEKSTQRCKKNTWHGANRKTTAMRVNSEINRFEDAIESVFTAFEMDGHEPTKDEFRSRLAIALGRKTEDKTEDVFAAYDRFMAEVSVTREWSQRTTDKMKALRNRLKEFDATLTFAALNEEGLSNLIYDWIETYSYRPSTVDKNLKDLRQFLNWATRKKYPVDQSYRDFEPKLHLTENKVIFLDWDELMKVYEFKAPPGRKNLESVRDVFCFCCFTGLRYSDVANLKKYDVEKDTISVLTVKTADALIIDLNKYSRAILDKYKDVPLPGDMALPVITNQAMNRELKDLMMLCGIDNDVRVTYYKGSRRYDEVHPKYELIGTHCGRKTFICNALMKGIPVNVVMKWTGHSDYASMKPYIAVADAAKAKEMKKFDE